MDVVEIGCRDITQLGVGLGSGACGRLGQPVRAGGGRSELWIDLGITIARPRISRLVFFCEYNAPTPELGHGVEELAPRAPQGPGVD